MKTIIASLAIALAVSASTISPAAATDKSNKKETTKAAATYQVGMYTSTQATKLNVMVAKEQGAYVQVQVLNEQGDVLAQESLGKAGATRHYRFDLSGLEDGKYQVVITDGKTKTVKEVNLATNAPTNVKRVISMR